MTDRRPSRLRARAGRPPRSAPLDCKSNREVPAPQTRRVVTTADKPEPASIRRSIAGLLAASAVLLLPTAACTKSRDTPQPTVESTTSHAPAKQIPPVLGVPHLHPYSQGFGTIRPRTVYNGGDPTGAFSNITWASWGGTIARGKGTANWTPANGGVVNSYPQPAQLAAYDLTKCEGRSTYRHLAVWFPTHGQHFDPKTDGEADYDLCQRQ